MHLIPRMHITGSVTSFGSAYGAFQLRIEKASVKLSFNLQWRVGFSEVKNVLIWNKIRASLVTI
jgi:hypothetical protein